MKYTPLCSVQTIVDNMTAIKETAYGTQLKSYSFDQTDGVVLLTNSSDARAFKVTIIKITQEYNYVREIHYQYVDNEDILHNEIYYHNGNYRVNEMPHFKIHELTVMLCYDNSINSFKPLFESSTIISTFNEKIKTGDVIFMTSQKFDVIMEFSKITDLCIFASKAIYSFERGIGLKKKQFRFRNSEINALITDIDVISIATPAMKSLLVEYILTND